MRCRHLLVVLGVLVLFCSPLVWEVRAQELAENSVGSSQLLQGAESTAANWLEPRGLNIVDLVGYVPEEYLQGTIISYTPGYGILVYESGSRDGDTVTVTTTVYPRYVEDDGWWGSLFGCLGQPARIDQWGSVAPATTVRLYHNGQDITSKVGLYTYVPAGLNRPVRNPQQSEWANEYRYWETGLLSTSFNSDGALRIPANMGCELIVSYENYTQLTAVFQAKTRSQASVEVVGTEEFTFHSYKGAGYKGLFQSLIQQLSAAGYGNRHEKFSLDIPAGADYFLLNFPPTPVDPYTQFQDNPYDNAGRPTGGTYRISGDGLSVDHVNAMGLPLYGHWRDMDQSGDVEYLPHFKTPGRLASPEYFVPAGVEYDPCMVWGGCSDELLQRVWTTEMTMTVVYLHVERVSTEPSSLPLRMVGPDWSPSGSASSQFLEATGVSAADDAPESISPQSDGTLDYHVYLPAVARRFISHLPPVTCAEYPCGLFTQDGRMVDFIPHP